MKTVVFDIETNGLTPDRIWYIVCKEYPSGDEHVFTEADTDSFMEYARGVGTWVGHNILWFDCVVLDRLRRGWRGNHSPCCTDTYVLSCLLDQRINGGHSIAAWGERLGEKKVGKEIEDWSQPTPLMLERCISDVRVNYLLYKRFLKYINSPVWQKAIEVEHFIATRCRELHDTGFHFSLDKAKELWYTIDQQLKELDTEIQKSFLPRTRLIREVTPRLTKHGTLNKSDFRFVKDGDLSDFNGGPFSLIEFEPFNPGSPVQIVERLNEAGWQPTEKTKGHIQAIRDRDTERVAKFERTGWTVSEENLNTLPDTAPPAAKTLAKRIMLASRQRTLTEWINSVCLETKINKESIALVGCERNEQTTLNTGNELKSGTENGELEPHLSPERFAQHLNTQLKKNENEGHTSGQTTASLSKILIEWLQSRQVNVSSVKENEDSLLITIMPPDTSEGCSVPTAIRILDGLKTRGLKSSCTQTRIRGSFSGIGAWTHRMSHHSPNTGNIAREDALYGAEMRSMWGAPQGSWLVGVDAESIQLRVLAHYINDEAFTQSLLTGKKEDHSDPHSLNQKALGPICASRNHAKTFIYAWLLGAGIGKVAQILECSYGEASEAVSNFIEFYPGLKKVKTELIPEDARRGYFQGFDGRWVKIWGEDLSSKMHFTLAGYLQNGEVCIMKHAKQIWYPRLRKEGVPFKTVNFVHDEWQTEVPDYETGKYVGRVQADSIRLAGELLNLRCPMAGSVLSGHGTLAIGKNWLQTH